MKKVNKWRVLSILGTLIGLLVVGLLFIQLNQLTAVSGSSATSTKQLSIPNAISTGHDTAKAVKVSGSAKNAKVSYRQTGSSANVATYQVKTANSTQAANAVLPSQSSEGEPVTLSDGTTATEQGVMGHIMVTWKQKNWQVTSISDTAQLSGTTPTANALKSKNQLKQQKITTQPVSKGSAVIYASGQDAPMNNISWRIKTKVQSVKAQEADQTVKIAKEALG